MLTGRVVHAGKGVRRACFAVGVGTAHSLEITEQCYLALNRILFPNLLTTYLMASE